MRTVASVLAALVAAVLPGALALDNVRPPLSRAGSTHRMFAYAANLRPAPAPFPSTFPAGPCSHAPSEQLEGWSPRSAAHEDAATV